MSAVASLYRRERVVCGGCFGFEGVALLTEWGRGELIDGSPLP